MSHKKEVVSHHSLLLLSWHCAKMHHTLGFPLLLSVPASVLVKKTMSEPECFPIVICGIISVMPDVVFVFTSQCSPKCGCGFEDSTGLGWFLEVTLLLRKRYFKFIDLRH